MQTAHMTQGSRDLPASLRTLARWFGDATGAVSRVHVTGHQRPLPVRLEALLLDVTREALINARDPGRAASVTVRLEYDNDAVVLDVRDDGTGMAHRELFRQEPGRRGIAALRAGVADAGGQLRLHDARPRGLLVGATVPTDQRRSCSSGGDR